MTATVIDGKAVAARLRAELAHKVAALPYQPGLAVVLVGDDPASAVYVRNKDRAASAAGIAARTIRLSGHTTQAELLALVEALNEDDAVDGILVQLPLPPQISATAIIAALDPEKDVDGLHPMNAGRLAAGTPGLVPCTPLGAMRLLAEAGQALSGARAVVLGRSVLVGRPMAALLTAADATPVTLAHSRTRNLAAECRRADVLVAAVGRPGMVGGEWIAPGATVIDVGINRLAGWTRWSAMWPMRRRGTVAGAITPVRRAAWAR